MVRAIVMFFCFVVLLVTQSHAGSNRLNIYPVAQQTPVWCWAAVSEMVLRHYRFPNLSPVGNYQCGIVGSLGGHCAVNCGLCVTAIGSVFQMSNVIANYQNLSDYFAADHRGRHFYVSTSGRLSQTAIANEVDEGNPIVAGISPSGMGNYYPAGMSEHVVLIVGYQDSPRGLMILVNDPMPYAVMGRNPYLGAGARATGPGQYWVEYRVFVHRLGYKDSIYFD